MGAKVIAGLLAGLPLAGAFILYYLLRGRALVVLMKSSGDDFAGWSDQRVYWIFLGAFVFGSFVLGAASGLVYALVRSTWAYMGLALGIAVLASIMAVISRTPMPVDKIVMNFLVAGVLGVLVPYFAGGW